MSLYSSDKIASLESVFQKCDDIYGENIFLRKIYKEDAEDILELYSGEHIALYEKAPQMKVLEDAQIFIEEINNHFRYKKRIDWAVVCCNSNKLVGLIGIHSIDVKSLTAEVGYLINIRYTNKGITTEALKHLAGYIFKNTPIYALNAWVHKKNTASIKVCCKAGFKLDNTYDLKDLKDLLLLSLINPKYYI